MIIYDGDIALHTPPRLWLASGMRALDHAIEILYNPSAAETPHKLLALAATRELFCLLPQSKANPDNADIRQKLQLAAFGTLFSLLFKGGQLSHSIGNQLFWIWVTVGYALGATYHIMHGITSCLTLVPVLRHKAITNPTDASQIARRVPYLGLPNMDSDRENALAVAEKVAGLVEELGLKSTLTEYGVLRTKEEMEGIVERALHVKDGDEFNAVVELVKEMY